MAAVAGKKNATDKDKVVKQTVMIIPKQGFLIS